MKTSLSRSFYVVARVLDDCVKYYSEDKGWIVDDFCLATPYDKISDIPRFTYSFKLFKIHVIHEDCSKDYSEYCSLELSE